MKRLVRALMCLAVLCAIPGALLAAVLSPAQYDETFLGALRDKVDLLERPGEKPRIILAGGSGAAFGYDSALLEMLLPEYETVNFGMYAGLGTAVMLDLAEDSLRPGDVFIFTPEQSEQTLSTYFNALSMWQAADGRFDLMARLNREDLSAMAGQLATFAADKLACLRTGKPAPEGVYSRSAFNTRGDVAALREGNVMPGLWDRSMPIRFDPAMAEDAFIDRVRAFAAHCRERNIIFLYRFCPMNAAAIPASEAARAEEFAAFLQDALGCDLLGPAGDSILEAGWFYDTNFHLNNAGAQVNTVRTAQALRVYLALPEGENPVLPDMPAPMQSAFTGGDSSDAACFTWVEEDGTARLTGLTAEGLNRTTLIIPAQAGNLPVTAFDAAVFAGHDAIRQIVVQENIRGIGNGAFAGCVNLERLVLLHQDPADCPVGEGLLTGTDCLVYVPVQRLSVYMTNYFWAVHAQRLRGDGTSVPVESAEAPEAVQETRPVIRYEGNGGVRPDGSLVLELPLDDAHLRFNTAPGTRYFTRPGHVLTGWNTAPDGSGISVQLGSRMERIDHPVLYAQWTWETPPDAFTWEQVRSEIHITAYRGTEPVCVVPAEIEGRKVTRICAGAFAGAEVDTVILPPTMFCVERGAFTGCTLQEIVLYDTLYYIWDESFSGCGNLATLRIHAATLPVYSGTYFDTFPDKMDWLASIAQEKKIVLFSGSSGRFGYDCEAIRGAFPEYQAANMGVYAYTNALPQLDLIGQMMQAGDILLSAPEFDTTNNQFCTTNALDAHFFAMVEGNYSLVSQLDLRAYTAVFDSLGQYLTRRSAMSSGSYSVSANGFDDDGNAYPFDTYNRYGDLILPREGSAQDVLLQHGLADYTVGAFPAEMIGRLNAAYQPFLQKGVQVLFTYTPRNWSSLTPESTPQARAVLHAHLREHLCVPVISDIEDFLYPGTMFYLIDSHLSTRGVEVRTERIIRDLQAWMEGAHP